MKNIPWYILIVSVIGLFIIISDCTKKTGYLEKYLGSWAFEYSWSREEGFFRSGDTTFYRGTINYGSCKSCLLIRYSEGQSKDLKVEPDGQILNTCEPSIYSPHSINTCSGLFEGDTIFHYNTFARTPPNRIVTNQTSIFGRKLE